MRTFRQLEVGNKVKLKNGYIGHILTILPEEIIVRIQRPTEGLELDDVEKTLPSNFLLSFDFSGVPTCEEQYTDTTKLMWHLDCVEVDEVEKTSPLSPLQVNDELEFTSSDKFKIIFTHVTDFGTYAVGEMQIDDGNGDYTKQSINLVRDKLMWDNFIRIYQTKDKIWSPDPDFDSIDIAAKISYRTHWKSLKDHIE